MSSVEEKLEKLKRYTENFDMGDIGQDEVDGYVVKAGYFTIDGSNLVEEVERQAAEYGYLSSLHVRAKREENKAKLKLKVLEAQFKIQLNQENEGRTRGERMTVDYIESLVQNDQSVRNASAEYFRCQERCALLESYKEASRQKAEMLKLIAVNVRKEAAIRGGK